MSQISRHRDPAGPPRQRSSSASIAGQPGASASSGTDGALAIDQRVRAALDRGWASTRSRMTQAREASAASTSRRLAVRS